MLKWINRHNFLSTGMYRANFDKYKDRNIDDLKAECFILNSVNKVITTMIAPTLTMIALITGFISILMNDVAVIDKLNFDMAGSISEKGNIISSMFNSFDRDIKTLEHLSILLGALLVSSIIIIFYNSFNIYVIEDLIKEKINN